MTMISIPSADARLVYSMFSFWFYASGYGMGTGVMHETVFGYEDSPK
jgi:hypothetical protein